MLCCVGLFAGLMIGQYIGGLWIYIAPAIGFGVGFIGDMKFMGCMHGRHRHQKDEHEKGEHGKDEHEDHGKSCH